MLHKFLWVTEEWRYFEDWDLEWFVKPSELHQENSWFPRDWYKAPRGLCSGDRNFLESHQGTYLSQMIYYICRIIISTVKFAELIKSGDALLSWQLNSAPFIYICISSTEYSIKFHFFMFRNIFHVRMEINISNSSVKKWKDINHRKYREACPIFHRYEVSKLKYKEVFEINMILMHGFISAK